MSNPQMRVLIVDDHPVFRFGLRALLESQPDFVVVGEAESGEAAVHAAGTLEPDLILMDVNLPDLNGIDATRRIVERRPEIPVLIITMFDDRTVLLAMEAGARGYLLKGAQGIETLRAARAVANGEIIISPGVARYLMAHLRHGDADPTFDDLTPREQEILALIAEGLTNGAIAERLILSPKTIRNQVSVIYGKLGVATRAEAIIKARDAGIGGK